MRRVDDTDTGYLSKFKRIRVNVNVQNRRLNREWYREATP